MTKSSMPEIMSEWKEILGSLKSRLRKDKTGIKISQLILLGSSEEKRAFEEEAHCEAFNDDLVTFPSCEIENREKVGFEFGDMKDPLEDNIPWLDITRKKGLELNSANSFCVDGSTISYPDWSHKWLISVEPVPMWSHMGSGTRVSNPCKRVGVLERTNTGHKLREDRKLVIGI